MQDDGSAPGTFHNFRAVMQARAAAQQHGLHYSLRHLFEVIAGYTNGSPAWPSYETLAGVTGLSPARVRKNVKALLDQGYLTRTRRPRPNGGWGQPEWALGPTCSQVEVGPGAQSSGPTRPLASGPTRPQKRVSGPRTVGRPPFVALMEDRREERREETAPLPPAPSKPKRAPTGKNSDVIDGLKDKGYRPTLREQDHRAIKDTALSATQIVEVYDAIGSGRFTDPFMAKGLTVQFAISRWDGYQASLKAPTNGRPARGASALQIKHR